MGKRFVLILQIVSLCAILLTCCQTENKTEPTIIKTKAPSVPVLPSKIPTLTITRTNIPSQTSTSTPTNTVEFTAIPTTMPSETSIPGVLVLSPDQSCQLVPKPEMTVNSLPEIYLEGKFYLCRQWPLEDPLVTFDLDYGRVGNNSGVDIKYSITKATIDNTIQYTLYRINSARLYQTEEIQPSLEKCQLIISTEVETGVMSASGAIACLVTNEGRIAYIRVEQLNPYGWGSIAISFITWQK